jgi:CelD/BcsL family acetyltransferase involved in cellulose biosynthesis
MIEGWASTGFEAMPDWQPVSMAALGARPTASTPTSAALPFARFCEDEALVHAWKRLESDATLPTQGHAFASALAQTLLIDSPIHVFLVRDGADIPALLALSREPGHFARWMIVGAHQMCEPDDALCRNPEAARRLADAIVADGRALELDRIPVGSLLIPALRSSLRGKGWMCVRPARPTPTIELDEGWKDPVSRFNSGRRSDFRRLARRAAEMGEVSLEVLSPRPDQLDALFDEAVAVEMRSWKREAGTAVAADPAKERCFRQFFRSACEEGKFRVAFLRIDGRAVAMQMALESLGRYWLFKIGFDEAFERCSPGTLLMLHTLGWAAKQELGSYELLGNVEPWIAQFWTREQHDCAWVRVYPFNARGAVAFAADASAALRRRLIPAKA